MELATCVSSSWSADAVKGYAASNIGCCRTAVGVGMTESFGSWSLDARECSSFALRTGSTKSRQVVCMAHPRRVKMVGEQIRREVAEMLLHDKVLQQAVLPESGLGADMYLSSVATVSEVEMSRDLQVAKVYISVFGDERGAEIAMEGLQAKAKYVRMGLGKRMQLRMTPEVRFIRDESMEKGSRVLDILSKLKEERERKERGEEVSLFDEEDDNWNDVEGEVEEKKQAKAKQKKVVPPKARDVPDKNVDWPMDIDWPTTEDDDDVSDIGADERIIFIK